MEDLRSQIQTTSAGAIWQQLDKQSRPEVRIVLKADTKGSLQVAQRELLKLSGKMVSLRIVRSEIGDVVPSDVFFAETAKAQILGYGVKVHKDAETKARGRVEIHSFSLLHALVDGMRGLLEDALPALEQEHLLGTADVRKVIKSSKTGKIAGCFVTKGVVRRGAVVRQVRGSVVIWQGKLAELKRFKEDAKEVRENFECGILLADRDDLEQGDLLEVYEIRRIKQRLK